MGNSSRTPVAMSALWVHTFFLLFLLNQFQFQTSHAQQSYIDNKQLNCQVNDSRTLGFVCNAARSCRTYLTFRTTPTYNSPVTIAYLLNSEATEIARINNISDVDTVPTDTLVIVPANCSCSGYHYQHNSSYVLKVTSETYYTVANVTYQGLTTCQSMMAQNPYAYLQLKVNMKLSVPLRCACPTSNQTNLGYKYLLAYLVTWGDTLESIAPMFGADLENIFVANKLSKDDLIFPFTPVLIPFKSEPTPVKASTASSLSMQQQKPMLPPPAAADPNGNSSRKWVFLGVGTGLGFLVICVLSGFLLWFFRYRPGTPASQSRAKDKSAKKFDPENVDAYKAFPQSEGKSWSEGIRNAVESFTVYEYEQVQTATGSFAEANRIKGSVFRGDFNGDYAAVKLMKGNVLEEINVLKKINHHNIIRLSGVCLHEGNTYLIYEYAERGSLSDLLHDQTKRTNGNNELQLEFHPSLVILSWKQRVQIAYDIADSLNYLHNYANPPYIHKNLKSSNILLDVNMRAKLANFGLARTLDAAETTQNEDGSGLQLQMTRHVIGTQGYMAPEYVENGLVTPKLDVFAFGVVLLELLSGRNAAWNGDVEAKTGEELLYLRINHVLDGENIRENLQKFMDPCLGHEYPLDMSYSMAQLAKKCVANDLNSRPTIAEVYMIMSKILSSSLDWDPSNELERYRSLNEGR